MKTIEVSLSDAHHRLCWSIAVAIRRIDRYLPLPAGFWSTLLAGKLPATGRLADAFGEVARRRFAPPSRQTG